MFTELNISPVKRASVDRSGQLPGGRQLGSNSANFRRPGATPEYPRGINKGMRYTRDLTDEQWKVLDPLIPKPTRLGYVPLVFADINDTRC